MRIKILGSSAGGGFPQWNCHCNNCAGMRTHQIKSSSRTQSSIAVDLENGSWALINASPDIHQQLASNICQPKLDTTRFNPISAIILIDSQLDHTVGLLSLREAGVLNIYATEPVFHDLKHEFPILNILRHYCQIHETTLYPQQSIILPDNPNISFMPIDVESKAPPYSSFRESNVPGANIALLITNLTSQKTLFYCPGLAHITPELEQLMMEMDCILLDGTFWTENEMISSGTGHKMAKEMGHIPVGGEGGILSYLNKMTKPKKYLIHINNTNPLLNLDSPEYQELKRHHVDLAYDGMEIIL